MYRVIESKRHENEIVDLNFLEKIVSYRTEHGIPAQIDMVTYRGKLLIALNGIVIMEEVEE